ncbi:MAG: flagellar brake protein, partial [Azonexus sp.]|nr:flagellar brake protein [Azonexus sp.]
MSDHTDEVCTPVFEIDQQDRYGQYMLRNPREIAFHLKTLIDKRSFLSLYLDQGNDFFLTNLLSVDEVQNTLHFDVPPDSQLLDQALKSRHITMSAVLDRVKIQLRLPGLDLDRSSQPPVLTGPFPAQML